MEVTCAELEQMVAIHIAEDAILATIAADSTRNEDEECVGRLPEALRNAWVALPITAPAPVPEPEAIVGPVVPPPPLDPVMPGPLARRQELAVVYELPNPGQATALAGFVGFGVGHWHGGCPEAAKAFTVLDGVTVAAAALLGSGFVTPDDDVKYFSPLAASAVLGVSRFVQIGTAGPCARRTAKRELGVVE